MAVQEFADAAGVRWRIWSVDPDEMHPTTRAEAFTADLTDGWLVFERLDGTEKRRLSPIPHGWDSASLDDLHTMLRRASTVTRRPRPTPSEATVAEHLAYGAEPRPPELRSFRFPGGRFWTVGVFDPPGGGRQLLRFMAGARVVDLDAWPADWAQFDDRQLSELLRQAERRSGPAGGVAAPAGHRRHDDRQR